MVMSKKEKTIAITLIWLLPFLMVWTAWVMTAMSFSPREIFNGNTFWTFSVVYWFIFATMGTVAIVTEG